MAGDDQMADENDEPRQGLDEGVVVSADAGTVSGLGADEELDEIEEDEIESEELEEDRELGG